VASFGPVVYCSSKGVTFGVHYIAFSYKNANFSGPLPLGHYPGGHNQVTGGMGVLSEVTGGLCRSRIQ
jgi:hypothetical protein